MNDIQPPTIGRQLALAARRVGGEVVLLPGSRAALTGTLGEVGQLLAVIQGAGQLVSASTPAPTGVPGQVLVNVRLAPRIQAHARPAPQRRPLPRWVFRSLLAGGLLLAALLVWGVYGAVTVIMAHLAVAGAVAAAVVLAVAVVLFKGRGGGGGSTFSGTFQGKIH